MSRKNKVKSDNFLKKCLVAVAILLIAFVLARWIRGAQPSTTTETSGAYNASSQGAVASSDAQGAAASSGNQGASANAGNQTIAVDENKEYTSKTEVAAYLHQFGHLPSNYITKNEAIKHGWGSNNVNLSDVLPGKSIGGTKFGNYEKKLPEKQGREYFECDIDYKKGSRGGKRLVYSNDGLIFYTEDHYETFEQLY